MCCSRSKHNLVLVFTDCKTVSFYDVSWLHFAPWFLQYKAPSCIELRCHVECGVCVSPRAGLHIHAVMTTTNTPTSAGISMSSVQPESSHFTGSCPR